MVYNQRKSYGKMKSKAVILFVLLSPIFLIAQKDTTQLKKIEKNSTDSLNKKLSLPRMLPPRELIIKMKDLKEIKKLGNSHFTVIDDSSNYTAEELASGLSEEELFNYKKNKEKLKELLTPPPAEDETYPAISTIRKILGAAKTAAVILILILSLL